MNPYTVVNQFEEELADFCGSKYCVAVDSCTNALFLCLLWYRMNVAEMTIKVPKHTYIGVPQSVLNAGHTIEWIDYEWEGAYRMDPTDIVDSAKSFHRDIYWPGRLWCLSFHIAKKLPIGRGGAILLNNEEQRDWLIRAKFDGRTPGQYGSASEIDITVPGYHMFMTPTDAARGVMLLHAMQHEERDDWQAYPDISELMPDAVRT